MFNGFRIMVLGLGPGPGPRGRLPFVISTIIGSSRKVECLVTRLFHVSFPDGKDRQKIHGLEMCKTFPPKIDSDFLTQRILCRNHIKTPTFFYSSLLR